MELHKAATFSSIPKMPAAIEPDRSNIQRKECCYCNNREIDPDKRGVCQQIFLYEERNYQYLN